MVIYQWNSMFYHQDRAHFQFKIFLFFFYDAILLFLFYFLLHAFIKDLTHVICSLQLIVLLLHLLSASFGGGRIQGDISNSEPSLVSISGFNYLFPPSHFLSFFLNLFAHLVFASVSSYLLLLHNLNAYRSLILKTKTPTFHSKIC